MPRRQVKEVPRWRRGQQKQSSGPVVRLSPKQEKALVAKLAAQAGLAPPADVSTATPTAPGVNKALAATGAYRFRRHLPPFAWLGWVLAAGLGTHGHSARAGLVLAVLTGAVIWLLTRHLPGCPAGEGRKHAKCFTRHAWQAMAALGALWVTALCLTGFTPPWPHVLVGLYRAVIFGSALCVIVPWVRHYRWVRGEAPQAATPAPVTDYVTWNALAAEKKWNATLGPVEQLPGGGRRYQIRTDGIKTVIGNVLSMPENVSGAWHKPMTEAYAERSPDGITSRGYLTVLGGDTLMRVREWNGAGIDPQTGTAMAGRFADAAAAHLKFFTPRYGTRHALVSGTTGSGKSEFLNLLIFIAIVCGYIVPVVLDPQEGQSLPFWRDRCLYAPGPDECLDMLRGLHAGMLDRSRYLASLRWDDDGVPMRGMPFFDHVMTGLPIILIVFDEAHMLLSGGSGREQSKVQQQAVKYTLEIGRLGRKTGTALWLGTHLPSLSDLGGEQALRDMLRGGNVVSFRTANAVATGMLGLQKDPSLIPQYFADGKETAGLGYVVGPDNRPDAPFRTDLVPKAMKRRNPVAPAFDDRFAEAMDRAMRNGSVQLPIPASAPLAAVPPAPEDEPAPPGRTASDAILAVMDEAGGELDRGELIIRCGRLVTAGLGKLPGWGRARPFAVRTMSLALAELENSQRIAKPRHGTYAPIRTTIHAVGASAAQAPGVSQR
jgi:hypothetical protein